MSVTDDARERAWRIVAHLKENGFLVRRDVNGGLFIVDSTKQWRDPSHCLREIGMGVTTVFDALVAGIDEGGLAVIGQKGPWPKE
jgi:hypothetical protein